MTSEKRDVTAPKFRRFELTIGVYLPGGAALPEDFREWLERATGCDLSDGPATATTLERVVETRYPLADDVIEKREGLRRPYA